MLRAHSHISPGAKLHLLTIGIDQYNEAYAKNLRLNFADRDARDLASAIINTQEALYQVQPTVLGEVRTAGWGGLAVVSRITGLDDQSRRG